MVYRDMENALLIACTVWGLRFEKPDHMSRFLSQVSGAIGEAEERTS